MQFRDLKKQYLNLREAIDAAIEQVLVNGHYIGGQDVANLEKELAEYVGVKHCCACANGTDALSLALMTWDIGIGHAVFVPDFTFFASAEAPALAGATPVFVDVDQDTFNMDPQSLKNAIEAVLAEGKLEPKVVVTVDLFGLPADYRAIRSLCDEYGLFLLEDAAQGFGGSIGSKRACGLGDISTTSFFPAKPLGCYGDGGAVFTDNDEWAETLKSLSQHGKGSGKYDNVLIGVNSRLDTIQAAILTVKFRAFRDHELVAINTVADRYTKAFKGSGYKPPTTPDGYYSSWAQYTIQVSDRKERDGLQAYLSERGIPSMVYYPKSLHKQTALKEVGITFGGSPVAELLSQTVLSLPISPYLEEADQEFVIESVLSFRAC